MKAGHVTAYLLETKNGNRSYISISAPRGTSIIDRSTARPIASSVRLIGAIQSQRGVNRKRAINEAHLRVIYFAYFKVEHSLNNAFDEEEDREDERQRYHAKLWIHRPSRQSLRGNRVTAFCSSQNIGSI
jgi:hypothetical protein